MTADRLLHAMQLEAAAYVTGGATIVEDINLEVRYGELLALVGPNGAGKSTVLGLLAGDLKPTAGRVELNGQSLAEYRPGELARERAVLMQSNQVAFAFTVLQVVEMGRAPWMGTAGADDDGVRIAEAIAQTDIEHLVNRSFPTLSGGEKARASLARVLAQDTPIVMLDEPTAALDLKHQEDVLRIARDLANAGRAVIAVLHDLSLAAAYADEVAIVSCGQIVDRGTPEAVLTEQRIEDVYGAAVRVIQDPDTGRPLVVPRRAAEPRA